MTIQQEKNMERNGDPGGMVEKCDFCNKELEGAKAFDIDHKG